MTAAAVQDDAKRESKYLSQRQLAVMSAACGISAANIYYNQPLLASFARYFDCSDSVAGRVSTAAQVGYGVGLFFFLPLGDAVERRTLVLWLTWICALLVALSAAASSIQLLVLLQLLVGITAMSAQLLIPLSVDLSPPDKRGRTVGMMMAGLLCGLLMARVVSGLVTTWLGWRAMFGIGAGLMVITAVVLHFELPRRPPQLRMRYGELMESLFTLLHTQKRAWAPSVISGISFGSFTAFWACLSFLMVTKFSRGPAEAGLFGIIGLIGAAGAPLAGKLSDRKGSAFTVTIALALTLAAFILMIFWISIPSLIVGVLLMDLGVQSVQVAEQSLVVSLRPDARSRMNTLYMVCRFIGAALGSYVGVKAWAHAGWTGVCATAMIGLAIAIALHLMSQANDATAEMHRLPPDLVTE